MTRAMTLLAVLLWACAGGGDDAPDAIPDAVPDDSDAGSEADAPPDAAGPRSFVAVTFNTGTSEGLADADPTDRYTPVLGVYSDQYYGDGLAWLPAVEAAAAFFDQVQPDVVAFQEIFYTGDCEAIPAEARAGFICEAWQPGDPLVAQVVLGAGYQVMCNPGKPDKCAAVRDGFGRFRGCDADLCLEGMTGFTVDGCGKGARVGRGVIDRVGGGTLTLVTVHGSSGFSGDDQACRTRQFEQIFVDLGDGRPAADGDVNLVLGDFNTDPYGLASDPSGGRLLDFVGPGKAFRFVTAEGTDAPPTYAAFRIDHVLSDGLTGTCWHPGVTEGRPPVLADRYFDHTPAVCRLALP